jgi:hypothetical protein
MKCAGTEAAKMHDGGAAIMAKIAAAARAAGVTNPIDSRRAAIAERHRAGLAAVAAAEAAKVRRRGTVDRCCLMNGTMDIANLDGVCKSRAIMKHCRRAGNHGKGRDEHCSSADVHVN